MHTRSIGAKQAQLRLSRDNQVCLAMHCCGTLCEKTIFKICKQFLINSLFVSCKMIKSRMDENLFISFMDDMQPASCYFVSDLIFEAEFSSNYETKFPNINSPDKATVREVIPQY